MQSVDVIDINVDPSETRHALRHRLLRFGIPIASVIACVGAILGIGLYSHMSNRTDAFALSRDLLVAVEHRMTFELESFLAPAFNGVKALAAVAGSAPFSDANRSTFERLAIQIVRDAPQVTAVDIGAPNGDFMLISKTPTGAIDTKVISHPADGRSVTWTRRNIEGEVIRIEADPSDAYDPRARPWYSNALASPGSIVWTDVYVFYTGRKPGITASIPVRDPAGTLVAVVGVDMHIDRFSTFLAELKVANERPRAAIVDTSERLVAYTDKSAIAREDGDQVRLARLDEAGDPVLMEAFDHYRIRGPGSSIIEKDGTRYLVLGMPLTQMTTNVWSLLLVVPESVFVGFVTTNSRKSLFLSLGVFILVIGLAALLAHQGLTADRQTQALRRRQVAMEAQSRAFAQLGRLAAAFDLANDDSVQRLMEIVAEGATTRRVSMWRLDASSRAIICVDCFDQEGAGHNSGMELNREEFPQLFVALLDFQEIDVADCEIDARMTELFGMYMAALGLRSLVSVPIVSGGGVLGFLWLEDAPSTPELRESSGNFARAVAHLIAAPFARTAPRTSSSPTDAAQLRRAEMRQPERAIASEAAWQSTTLADVRNGHFATQASRSGPAGSSEMVATPYSSITVMVLAIRDDFAMASKPDPDSQNASLSQIANECLSHCGTGGISCVKILADKIIVAHGFDGEPQEAASQLADIALGVRDRCTSLFRRLRRPPDFGIGVDTGNVYCAWIGADHATYNVWGDAVRVASNLAASAGPGTIQATETAYEHLRDRFILQRRGSYQLPNIGPMTTYTIRGAL